MKTLHFVAALAALALCISCSKSDPLVVKVDGGKIKGVASQAQDVAVFKGIPYAAPPVGDLRWKKPQPVVAWRGVRDCSEFGNISIQLGHDEGSFYWKEFYYMGFPTQSEDCLYLNVYAPAGSVGNNKAKLPVAMWVHGGAFHNGYSNEITMDGDAWAQRGVILVTINYRLGLMGFLNHPELTEEGGGTSGGYGMYDQIAALQWVHDNISAFGGDPDNITVFGQSAGAMSVKNLVASPLSKGLIAKAIIQSGGGLNPQGRGGGAPAGGQANYDRTGTNIQQAGGFADLKAMRAATPDELKAAVAKLTRGVSYRPHTDGVMLTESFDEAVWDNSIADIPYMIGCTAQDMGGLGGAAIDRFADVRDSLSTKPVYKYFFQRNPPGDDDDPEQDAGAFHSSELWYMFHTLDRSWRPFTKADYELSDRMMDYWTNFCKYADPKGGWMRSTRKAPYTQILDIK